MQGCEKEKLHPESSGAARISVRGGAFDGDGLVGGPVGGATRTPETFSKFRKNLSIKLQKMDFLVDF